MDWQNLRDNKCPHCANELGKTPTEYLCTHCSFHISVDRFKMIVEHRRDPAGVVLPKFKWQNLRDGRCPADAAILEEFIAATPTYKCSKPTCGFRIREEKMQEIFADANHPANKLYQPIL